MPRDGRFGRVSYRCKRRAKAMKVDLNHQVALVTGAARGIGQAIADTLAANGARVVYSDIDLAGAEESATKSPGCKAMALDVTNSSQVESVLNGIFRELGRLDILVNNAGVNTLTARVTIEEFPREEWDRILNVDLTGVYLVSKAAARVMLGQRSGRILNIASIAR